MTRMVGPLRTGRWSTRRIVLTVVGAVLAACCVGGSVFGYLAYRSVESARDEPGPAREAVNTFAGHLEAGRYDAAYDGLCAATRDAFTPERFTETASARPRLTGHRVTGANVVAIGDTGSGGVTADLTYADGGSKSHLFPMTKEGGDWKVCGQPY
jgi:hypothetical protein